MHDRQYRDYKSGVAKKRFEDELQHAKDASMAKSGYSEEDIKKLKRAKADRSLLLITGRYFGKFP